MMHLIDSHCHLDFSEFDDDRENILSHCEQIGVKNIIVPSVMANSWDRLIDICQQSNMLYPALGLHPMFMDNHQAEDLIKLTENIALHKPVAIGEIGLDFYIPEHDKVSQTSLFEQQLTIAKKTDLPVILHVRKAHDQTLLLLKKHTVKGGIIHAFNGSEQQAQQYIKLGFLFGVGGVITHKRATRLRQLFSILPLSSLVLETDAPDMPLSDMSEQRNTPENIPTILDCLAKIRSESKAEIATATTTNCQHVLNFDVD
jgi:TatD DNase family protein